MKVLVINCGSSSLKYQVFNMENEEGLAKGIVERIGISGSQLKHEVERTDEEVVKEQDLEDHKEAFKLVVEALTDDSHGVLSSMSEIDAVGHRVAHGGEEFSDSSVIDENALSKIEDLSELAPLHNPPNVHGIKAAQELIPDAPMVAVFDTSFHQSMPEQAYLYGIPYEIYERQSIRRYGFHGTSHKYVAGRAASMLNKPLEDLKIITCHLGNGASIAAVNHGESVDTSMGFTPLEGLVMGTRSGSFDPAVIPFLMENEDMSTADINKMINKQSGVLGISGVSSDFRDLEEKAESGHHRSQAALDVFSYTVTKYIGAYMAAMDGVDAIVFTAGLGENSPSMRKKITESLGFAGIKVDHNKNDVRGKETVISADDASVQTLIVPTNEELMIARDTKKLTQ